MWYFKKSRFNYSDEGHSCEYASISERSPMKFKFCVAQNTTSVLQGVGLVARVCIGKDGVPVLALVQPESFGQRTAGEGTHFSYQFCIFGMCFPLFKLHFLLLLTCT